jgi:hypothetical protein
MPDLKTVQEFVGEDFTADEWSEIDEAQNRYYLELAQERSDNSTVDDSDDFYYMTA